MPLRCKKIKLLLIWEYSSRTDKRNILFFLNGADTFSVQPLPRRQRLATATASSKRKSWTY